MKKIIILLITITLQSCSMTIILSDKSACIHGDHNRADISGSHLRNNNMDGSADGNTPTLTIPVK